MRVGKVAAVGVLAAGLGSAVAAAPVARTEGAAPLADAPTRTLSQTPVQAVTPATPPPLATPLPTSAASDGSAPAASPPAPAGPPLVRYTLHTPPGFLVMHGPHGNAAFGAYGSVELGAALLKDNDIPDPAIEMAQTMAERFAATRQALVGDAPLMADQLDAEAIFYQATDGVEAPQGYVVDVATTSWSVLYYTGDSQHYFLDYRARLQVIDLAGGRLLLEATCEHHADKAADAFIWDQIGTDGPTGLKARMHAVVAECLAQFRTSTHL